MNAWEQVQLARHPERPMFLDYASELFTEFDALSGDRNFADDKAMIGGLARFEGAPCVVVGQHRGRGTRERVKYHFGMSNPEGYRKALRLFELAERFELPVFSFVDTQGAYPGVEAEERGQAQAIAANLAVLSRLKVPVIATVIGEGGSGGALGIAVADKVNMLENSIYSVISPEGCASILWKSSEMAAKASEILCLTAAKLKQLGLIDEVVKEDQGAHVNPDTCTKRLKDVLSRQLSELNQLTPEHRCDQRYQRLMSFNRTRSL